MQAARCEHRVVIMLNTRIALEAVVLNRLQQLPSNRQEEWLRGLIIQGFRVESQVTRALLLPTLADDKTSAERSHFSHWLSQSALTGRASAQSLHPADKELSVLRTDKPFADLSKVIG